MTTPAPAPLFAWLSPNGQWLTFYESTTHTGTHKRVGLTSDINQAFVGYALPKYNEVDEEMRGHDLELYIRLRATAVATRTVTLVPAKTTTGQD